MIPQRIRDQFPWPAGDPSVAPYMVNLDFGGRHLVTELIESGRAWTVLEIGSFLGGSTEQWLKASGEVQVVAVDPWPTLPRVGTELSRELDWFRWPKPREHIVAQLNAADGLYRTFLANMAPYRDRVVPVRARSEDVLAELKRLGLEPDLIYIDADKKRVDLDLCLELFPGAILSGDDYLWRPEPGKTAVERIAKKVARRIGLDRPLGRLVARAVARARGRRKPLQPFAMRLVVDGFAADHGYQVVHDRMTWLLEKR